MTLLVVVASIVLSISGLAVSLWSIYTTRKKYYLEYKGRKMRD